MKATPTSKKSTWGKAMAERRSPRSTAAAGLQVRDLHANALGFTKRILRVKNYPANALVMSDILLLSPLQSPAQRALLPVVKIQGM